ncbi:MAG TPA: response regulator transcription factor [Streptosporangiaceae bacterium]|nr:response regulator transcription factor [Streptosporangiaceae bacterium]
MRVLLAEDHAKLATTLATGLRREGMAVDIAFDGQDALDRIAETAYDVVVLDRDLPRVHGDDVCREIAAAPGNTRVLMLTAARSVSDRVDGLRLGADDYLPKPFAFSELVARIQALSRRAAPAQPLTLVHGDLTVDPGRRIATRAGKQLALTPKEFAVLERLLAAQGRVLTVSDLLEGVWDEMTDQFTGTVKVTISRLRAKLGEPPVIATVPPGGYRI